MKTTKRKGPPGQRQGAARGRSRSRAIVLLDQAPLRKAAAAACNREMARLEKAKAEWRRFQTEDEAGFNCWMAATFGAALSRMRDLEALLQEKEEIVDDVETELIFGKASTHRAAYAAVQRRRASEESQEADEAEPSESESEAPEPDLDRNPFEDEHEQEILFEEFLRLIMGLNPARMTRKKYDSMFAEFKADVLGIGAPAPARAPEPPRAPESVRPDSARVKELYRILVRRLHPDTRADTDAEVSALWHEVQEAYGAGNLERLEMLLALTDVQSQSVGEHTTISQMRCVVAELRRSYNAVRRNLAAARKTPAWGFGAMGDRAPLQKKIRAELEAGVRHREKRLLMLETMIAGWSAERRPRKKSRHSEHGRFQSEFPF